MNTERRSINLTYKVINNTLICTVDDIHNLFCQITLLDNICQIQISKIRCYLIYITDLTNKQFIARLQLKEAQEK